MGGPLPKILVLPHEDGYVKDHPRRLLGIEELADHAVDEGARGKEGNEVLDGGSGKATQQENGPPETRDVGVEAVVACLGLPGGTRRLVVRSQIACKGCDFLHDGFPVCAVEIALVARAQAGLLGQRDHLAREVIRVRGFIIRAGPALLRAEDLDEVFEMLQTGL